MCDIAKRAIIFILLILLALFPAVSVSAEGAEASPYLPCEIAVPAGRENAIGNLTDGNSATRFTLTSGQTLSVAWTGEASGVLLDWYDTNYRVTINLYTPTGELLSSTPNPELQYRMFLPAEGAGSMEILCAKGWMSLASLCELRVCAAGYEPPYLTKREPVDLMLVLSGMSEETDLLGGLLPLYTGEHHIRTAIVYVGKDDGNQVQEGFRALEAMGVDVIPIFLQKDDQATCSIDRLGGYWKETQLIDTLFNLFKKYRPTVVVTCDPQDTLSMVRTPYTARLTERILRSERADSLSVQKFYHLSEGGQTVIDWTKPLVSYDGRTAREVAETGYAEYRSEACFGTVIPESSRFLLAYSKVGEDEARNDLFEHIAPGDLLRYAAPTQTPAPTPKPTEKPTPTIAPMPAITERPTIVPTVAPTAAPTAASTAESAPEPGREKSGPGRLSIALFAASGASFCAALCLRKKKRTSARILFGAAAGLLILGLVFLSSKEPERQTETQAAPTAVATETPSPTAEPTPEPTSAPAAEPTEAPAPTPEPMPTPDPNDRYFRQEGEPEEVIIQDYDNGHWEYRSDILSVMIDRETFKMNNHPYCQYIAHIRMRKVNSFRSIVSSHMEIATASEPPWRLARNFRTVLAITGDNINNADLSYKGILIRRGILYSDHNGEDTLVIRDDFTMDIIHRGEASGVDLLDSGVLSTYSFGPTLVENHEINPNIGRHRVVKENPRCGIGMVEPGHFVAIVTDGRDERRAFGYTMEQFAKVFLEQGVEIAYNLDGGSSAAMVFMGEHVNWHSDGTQRTWADALAWGYSRQVPDPTVIATHIGEGVIY